MNFSSSTQKTNWLFSEEALSQTRQNLGFKIRDQALQNKVEGAPEPPAIEVQEEETLLRGFQDNVSNIVQSIATSGHRVLPKVKACALMYFKRYYLGHSALERDPLPVLLYCIFLAGKVENAFVPLEPLVAASGRKKMMPQDILKHEFPVLQSLHYDLIVYTPYRSLQGFIQDIERCQHQNQEALGQQLAEASPQLLHTVHQKATDAVDKLMMTDAPLIFPPAQLALAALRVGCKNRFSLSKYIQYIVAQQEQQPGQHLSMEQRLQQLTSVLDKIDRYGAEGATKPGDEAMGRIMQRAKKWWQLSSAAAARQAAATNQERDQRREAKVKDRAVAMEAAAQRVLQGS